MFNGFPAEQHDFFEAVARDTSWSAVAARRDLHERAVRMPMQALVDELESDFGPAKVYRLHRSPRYWVEQWAYVQVVDTIAYGISLSRVGLWVEGGWLRSSPDQVARYRAAVDEELEQIVAHLKSHRYELLGERLKRAPSELLAHRSLVAGKRLGDGPVRRHPEARRVVGRFRRRGDHCPHVRHRDRSRRKRPRRRTSHRPRRQDHPQPLHLRPRPVRRRLPDGRGLKLDQPVPSVHETRHTQGSYRFAVGDKTPQLLFRLTCANGHPWMVYGPDQETHWGPVQCVKCAAPWVEVEKIAELARSPKHRFSVRLRQADGLPAQEQIVLADSYERREDALVFLTGPHVVARYRQALGDPTLIS
jgi:uncharacterized protein (DUF2461 family)